MPATGSVREILSLQPKILQYFGIKTKHIIHILLFNLTTSAEK